jgi:uncharacterized repeat protein (TIGR01451 family)
MSYRKRHPSLLGQILAVLAIAVPLGILGVGSAAAKGGSSGSGSPTFVLSVTRAGTGTGTVTSSPSGINCGTTCSANFTRRTVVTLTAAPAANSTFAGWSGACTGTGTCTVTMNAAQSVTATFTGTAFPLSVAKAGSGAGTVTSTPAGINCGTTCSASFPANSVVSLTAAPAAGSTFGGWSGACSGTTTCSVTMSAAASVAATFNNPTATPPDLTINQTASATSVATGGPLSYTLKVSATGATVAGLKVQDTLPGGATVVSVTPNSGFTCSTAAGVVACTGGSLAAGSSATIVISLNAPNVACGTTQTLTNTAVVDPDNTIVESNETNNTAAAAPVTATGDPCLSEPPLTGHQIIGFPSRDFVSTTGWAPNESLTLKVLRNSVVVGTSQGTADATGTFEVNHPGGFCWQKVTPDIRPGDILRITHDATGAAEQTRVRNVTAGAAAEVPAGSGTVVIHGTAQDAAGNPFPLAEIEERLIGTSADRFAVNNKRDIRAPGQGTLTYDPVDPTTNPKGINWTATYHLSAADVTRALAASSRMLWLGPLGAASTELTIFEYGFGNGPTAGCIGNFAPPEVTAHANPVGGTYAAAQSVVLTHDDPAAVIFYTTDGTDPTTSSRQYTAPISIAASTTLKFMAMGASGMPDQIFTEVYTINIPAPTVQATPRGGAFTTAQSVTLTASDPAAAIFYTTDGSEPTQASTRYTGTPITIEATTTLKFRAFTPAGGVSTIGSETYTINISVSDPPLTGHQILGFPSRDFVSSTGWAPNESLTLHVLRNGVVVGVSQGTADATGTFEVNHPGGFCWQRVTPDIRPGDILRITHDATGAAEQTLVRNVTAGPPVEVPAGSGTLVIHGAAQDAAGNPLPLGDIEERLIGVSADPFDLNGRRDLRAPGDGTLAYDPISPDNPKGTKWTATYHLSAADVTRALGAQSRILWLGPLGAASTELTIMEYGFGNGPTAGCIGNFAPPEVTAHATPPGGTYTTAQSVVLTHDDPAAVIFYTTDGTDPTTSSRQYTAPIPITASTTLKFMAMGANGLPDQILTEVYTITP